MKTKEEKETPIQELFRRFGYLLPNIEKEFLEKESNQVTITPEQALDMLPNKVLEEEKINDIVNSYNKSIPVDCAIREYARWMRSKAVEVIAKIYNESDAVDFLKYSLSTKHGYFISEDGCFIRTRELDIQEISLEQFYSIYKQHKQSGE